MIQASLINTLRVDNELGEGVVWHNQRQTLWWTDILSAQLFEFHPETNQIIIHTMPERVGSFGFTSDVNTLIVAFASGVAYFHLKKQSIQWITRPEANNQGNRFNDGRVDRLGNFWAGSLVENESSSTDSAALYRISPSGECQKIIDSLSISNALCFDLDGKHFYHTDTPLRQIQQYLYNEHTGKAELVKQFVQTEAGCFPDGACIDSENHLWNAQWGGHNVVRYNQQGQIDFAVEVPVPQPSCVAIGGPNMNWLFVTSAKQGMSDQALSKYPLSGSLFIYQLNKRIGIEECQHPLL